MTTGSSQPSFTAYSMPSGEEPSQDFKLIVNGSKVPVYQCRVSAVPFNQAWPGYQRPLDQTEIASFAYWDMAGPVDIEVISHQPVQSVTVRPSSRGIKAKAEGNRITFRLNSPQQIAVEVNGLHKALHLFANPPAAAQPDPQDPGVLYFGPGVHRPGKIMLEDDQIVYLAEGAVVYGAINGNGVSNVRIFGRGIIDASNFKRGKGGGCIRLSDCRNVSIEGIILRDPDVWCLTTFGCAEIDIANVKLIGLWRYNADGIDICNSQNVTIRDCFIRSYDDSIALKGLKGERHPFSDRPVRNVVASGCVIWNDWGRALEIGAETSAPEFTDIIFRNCDIIRNSYIAMDIQHGDRAAVSNILFEDIRIEIDDVNYKLLIQKDHEDKFVPDPDFIPSLLVIEIRETGYSQDQQRGTAENITFRNIHVTGKHFPPSRIQGFDDEHQVKNVSIENLSVNGRVIKTLQDADVTIKPFVQDVRLIVP